MAHGVAISLVWSVESLARQREGPAVGKSSHRQARAEWDPDEAVARALPATRWISSRGKVTRCVSENGENDSAR